jgi:sugar phosphate isomerase/epimerase
MRRGEVHLSYCSNIHPAQTWAETREVLRGPVPRVKAALSPDAPFGVGLRLSGEAAAGLRADDPRAWRQRLADAGLYVFTLNGFPYGRFHGAPVKAQVYRPDWREPARVAYTRDLIEVLAALLPDGVDGSISTVPGCFRAHADAAARATVAQALRTIVADLARLERERGIEIVLALEPEPACMLETTAEAIAFVQSMQTRDSIDALAGTLGSTTAQAESALARHLGLCLDTCHAAVQFEDPVRTVQDIARAGIRIGKVQATTGLCIEPVDTAAIEAVEAFADAVYLHQVVARYGTALTRYDDLPEAIDAYRRGIPADEWRVHFHIPVFEHRPEPFANTQDFLHRCLPEAIAAGCRHVEVETYTWDVLPPALRSDDVVDAIVRELEWTRDALP